MTSHREPQYGASAAQVLSQLGGWSHSWERAGGLMSLMALTTRGAHWNSFNLYLANQQVKYQLQIQENVVQLQTQKHNS